MFLIIFTIIAVFVLIVVLSFFLLNLTLGISKLLCTFTKPAFAMFISLLFASGGTVTLVQNSFWNWLLFALIVYAVIFVICGFPRVNSAFNAFTSCIIVFLVCAVVGSLLLAIAGTIIGEGFWPTRFWEKNNKLICLLISFAGPFITNYLQKHFTTESSKKVGEAEIRTRLLSHETVEIYETTETVHDMSTHFFTFGDRWPVFQRVLASFLYALYPGLLIMDKFTELWGLEADLRGWAVCIATLGVLMAAAYAIQLLAEKRMAARAEQAGEDPLQDPAETAAAFGGDLDGLLAE